MHDRTLVSEPVCNSPSKNRTHADPHHLDRYYDLRNHIVDFLIRRAKPGEAHQFYTHGAKNEPQRHH